MTSLHGKSTQINLKFVRISCAEVHQCALWDCPQAIKLTRDGGKDGLLNVKHRFTGSGTKTSEVRR